MRGIVLAVAALQISLALPAWAESPADAEGSISQALPLFESNHCRAIRDPAEQLFCGDPELNAAAAKLNAAIQQRLSRLTNRGIAIEENAEWIRNRNASCGIVGRQGIANKDVGSTKACLVTETEERIEILTDPNFDCLATNTTAGLLICGEPGLALAKMDFNDRVLALIARLNESDARAAFAEVERWGRERDRKCDLAGKDNVPLDELASSEGCLSEYFSRKTAEVVAARGDPRKVFARQQLSPSPDADAVDRCVAQIHSANACENFLTVSGVFQVGNEVAEKSAQVTAQIEMVVLSPFAACSAIASGCTGTCWDLKSGQPKPTPGSRENLLVSYRVRIAKAFAFQKADSGGWRCDTTSLQPVDTGVAASR
jgi:uncharacterized protein YecT (DUF1311 family)